MSFCPILLAIVLSVLLFVDHCMSFCPILLAIVLSVLLFVDHCMSFCPILLAIVLSALPFYLLILITSILFTDSDYLYFIYRF
jgi:hypothetical protein